jgi:hypothetical protein
MEVFASHGWQPATRENVLGHLPLGLQSATPFELVFSKQAEVEV